MPPVASAPTPAAAPPAPVPSPEPVEADPCTQLPQVAFGSRAVPVALADALDVEPRNARLEQRYEAWGEEGLVTATGATVQGLAVHAWSLQARRRGELPTGEIRDRLTAAAPGVEVREEGATYEVELPAGDERRLFLSIRSDDASAEATLLCIPSTPSAPLTLGVAGDRALVPSQVGPGLRDAIGLETIVKNVSAAPRMWELTLEAWPSPHRERFLDAVQTAGWEADESSTEPRFTTPRGERLYVGESTLLYSRLAKRGRGLTYEAVDSEP